MNWLQQLNEMCTRLDNISKYVNELFSEKSKLQSENSELKSQVKELTEQLEKMKTCDNCSSNCRKRGYYHILNCPDWKFRG